jgi:hypothetical protein
VFCGVLVDGGVKSQDRHDEDVAADAGVEEHEVRCDTRRQRDV